LAVSVEVGRVCPGCGDLKEPGEFAVDRSKRSGRKSRCKECDREQARRYYAEHREERLAKLTGERRAAGIPRRDSGARKKYRPRGEAV
jgi:hypothetical protein